MLNFFKKLFGLVSIDEALHESKKVKIKGVLFTIKKINTLDYLNGSKVMLQIFDTYKKGTETELNESYVKKMKDHYRDVIMSGVIKPKLSRKENDGTLVWVDEVINDWEMASELYSKIIEFTYGKKKLIR